MLTHRLGQLIRKSPKCGRLLKPPGNREFQIGSKQGSIGLSCKLYYLEDVYSGAAAIVLSQCRARQAVNCS